MDSQTSPLLQPLQTSSGFLVFSLIITFSLTLLALSFLNKHDFWCCINCQSYLKCSWSLQFVNLCDWFAYLLQNSPTQTIHLHVQRNIITANPKNVEYILKTNFSNYPKGKAFSMILGDLLGEGIFNADGDLWMFQRKMASLELSCMSIRKYAFDNVNNEIKHRLLPLLSSVAGEKSSNGVFDLQDVLRRFSFDNICKFSFGLDPCCLELSLPISSFADSFDLATKLSAERALMTSSMVWKIKRLINVGTEKKLRQAIDNVNILASEVIRQKRKLGFSKNQDLLSRFMAIVDDDSYLRDIVISFMLAGRDTVASALTCFFWLLSSHPEIETRIRKESDHVLEPDQESITYDQLKEMHYLHASLYESMRLYPPVQFDSKFALEDDVLPDGTFVRKNTRVTYHSYAMGRMETIWGRDCMEFNPERWLKSGKFCTESPFKYPVFHAGVRVCLGKEMAIMEMKCVVVSVLRHFDIRVVAPAGGRLKFDPALTATVSGGLPVIVRERRGVRLKRRDTT